MYYVQQKCWQSRMTQIFVVEGPHILLTCKLSCDCVEDPPPFSSRPLTHFSHAMLLQVFLQFVLKHGAPISAFFCSSWSQNEVYLLWCRKLKELKLHISEMDAKEELVYKQIVLTFYLVFIFLNAAGVLETAFLETLLVATEQEFSIAPHHVMGNL